MIAGLTVNVAWIVLAAITVSWVIYGLFNIRGSRREYGSEIELAANRKPYYDDEVLEGKKLERTQLLGPRSSPSSPSRFRSIGFSNPAASRTRSSDGASASRVGAASCSMSPPTAASTAQVATAA
jgi:hypothetical protein